MRISYEYNAAEEELRIELVTPSPAQLASYEGEYGSDEVQATYKIVLDNGKLFLRHENEYKDYPRSPLAPTVSDAFSVQGLILRFERDACKQVAAFTLNAGRVKNIRFVKKQHRL